MNKTPIQFKAGQRFERKDGVIIELLRVRSTHPQELIKAFGSHGIDQMDTTAFELREMLSEGLIKEL